MVQCIFDGHFFEFRSRFMQEGTAGGGQDYLFDRTRLPHETLENCRVFRIYGQDRRPVFGRERGDDFPRHDEALFVGKSYFFSVQQGADGREEPAVAHQSHDYRVDRFRAYHLLERLLAGVYFDRLRRERFPQGGIKTFVCNDDVVGSKFDGLCRERFPIAVRGECGDLEPFGVIPHDVEGLGADRTGRA